MLEGFSGTLVLMDELASSLSSMREARRRSPHRCLKTLAQPGTNYHGSLYLAVQYASVIFKQLFDFRTGARTNAVMSLLASI